LSSSVDQVVKVALADVGRTDAEYFRAGGPGRDWCAYWVSSVLERAAAPAPLPTDRARRGARALVRWLARGGRWVFPPGSGTRWLHEERGRQGGLERGQWAAKCLQPADVIAWSTSRIPGDWRGHVAIVVGLDERPGQSGVVEIVHANVGGQVRRQVLGPHEWLWVCAGGVYGVARVFEA
jgi:hypothetical protein